MQPLTDSRLQEVKRQKRYSLYAIVAAVVLVTLWSCYDTGFTPVTAIVGSADMLSYVAHEFLPPKLSSFRNLLGPTLETICMAYVAMVIGAVLSAVLAFLAADTTSPHPAVKVAVRAFASVMRNMPALIWALFLVAAYGLGAMVGTIALIITAFGTLTRAFADVLEEIDMDQVESVRATGASYWQVVAQGVIPQFWPGFVAWSLYKLELNIRASTIIGMVGGGGLGFAIQKGLKLFQFKEVTLAIVMVFILIGTTELLTSRIRRRIL